ncbi:hypothetical protein MUK42_35618 [Musa troglodytarum]|uniref:Uncharacterized protein n=1 Tax=Musa troglodytarum TaxID=320322 RepID=A0A9E7HAH5_9LILI|nr:hypothetical protein MUK42_35618 [Musa troglodytarum]
MSSSALQEAVGPTQACGPDLKGRGGVGDEKVRENNGRDLFRCAGPRGSVEEGGPPCSRSLERPPEACSWSSSNDRCRAAPMTAIIVEMRNDGINLLS